MDCPFHPKRDLLWWPEPRKDVDEDYDDESFWTCPVCGKSFMCAERLAMHWDDEHRPDANRVSRRVRANSISTQSTLANGLTPVSSHLLISPKTPSVSPTTAM